MRYTHGNSFGAPSISPVVKGLAIANIASWFVLVLVVQQFFLEGSLVFRYLGLVPSLMTDFFLLWQPLTYMFIHSSGLFHILFNLIVLWMFGSELERLWGGRFFLIYYLTSGAGAALIYCFVLFGAYLFFPSAVGPYLDVPVVGSSGAVFGLMAAYGWIFKNRIVYVMMIFPMKARTFTYLLIGIEVLSMLSSGLSGPVANLAHLGGLLSGAVFLTIWKNWNSISLRFKRKTNERRLHIVRPDETKRKIWH